jgi:hypothetical protein
MKGVIQYTVADYLVVPHGDEAITRVYLAPDELSSFLLMTRDEVKRAEFFNISLNGWSNRNNV